MHPFWNSLVMVISLELISPNSFEFRSKFNDMFHCLTSIVLSEMGGTKFSHICWFSIHRLDIHYVVMVRLGLLCEHRIWRHDTGTELVLAVRCYQYFSCLYIGRRWWEIGEEDWIVGATWWVIKQRKSQQIRKIKKNKKKLIEYIFLLKVNSSIMDWIRTQRHWYHPVCTAYLAAEWDQYRPFECISSFGWFSSIFSFHTLKSTTPACCTCPGAMILVCGVQH